MEEFLHQLLGSLSHYLNLHMFYTSQVVQDFSFSSIPAILQSFLQTCDLNDSLFFAQKIHSTPIFQLLVSHRKKRNDFQAAY